MSMLRRLPVVTLFVLLLCAGSASGQGAPEYGPPTGTLVIVGGAMKDPAIANRFIELAGGPDAKFVIVPTAGGNRRADGTLTAYVEEAIVAPWKKLGLKHVTMLHTHDPKVADTEDFVRQLRQANAVWFNGGRQWNIVDSYANTLTLKEFHNVLARGGVIDEAALIRALKENWIAGAGLDVFEQEPLPAESELWKLENALIAPHVSSATPHYDDRAAELFCENLRRYLRRDALLNSVSRDAGY